MSMIVIEQSCFYFASLAWQENTFALIDNLQTTSQDLHTDLKTNLHMTEKISTQAITILTHSEHSLHLAQSSRDKLEEHLVTQ